MKKTFILVLLAAVVLLSGCSGHQSYEPEWTKEQERVYTFSDGNYVDKWSERMYAWSEYRLPDGTVLAIEDVPRSVENTSVIGIRSFQTLSEAAQEKIIAYYAAQGLLYSMPDVLERAYAEHRADSENFSHARVGQAVAPTKFNDRVVCFLTTVSLPVSGQVYTEARLSAYFDPQTGEQISVWDLFKIPEEQAREWIVEQFNPDTQAYRDELRAALKPEHIMLSNSHLEIMFSQGELESQPYSTGAGIDYADLTQVMHDWALAE